MTSVEWLAIQLYEKMNMQGDGKVMDEILNQAKEMHKQEIEQAYYDGGDEMCPNGVVGGKQAEQYYNETFKNQQQ